jgi:hypothetical protein
LPNKVPFLRLEEPSQRTAYRAVFGNLHGWMRNRLERGEQPFPDALLSEKVQASQWLRQAAYVHLYLEQQDRLFFRLGIKHRCQSPWVAGPHAHGCGESLTCPWCRYRGVLRLEEGLPGGIIRPRMMYRTSTTTFEPDHLGPILLKIAKERRDLTKALRRQHCPPVATIMAVRPQERAWEAHCAILLDEMPTWSPLCMDAKLWRFRHGPVIHELGDVFEYSMLNFFKPEKRLLPLSKIKRVRTISLPLDRDPQDPI